MLPARAEDRGFALSLTDRRDSLRLSFNEIADRPFARLRPS
jgi:hypothetical protein